MPKLFFFYTDHDFNLSPCVIFFISDVVEFEEINQDKSENKLGYSDRVIILVK